MGPVSRRFVPPCGSRRRSPAGLLVVLMVLLSACGGGGPETPPAADAQPAAGVPVAAAPQPDVDEALQRARQALAEERLVTPPGDNAIEHYLRVLELDPTNPQATQAVVDVFPLAAGAAERALDQREVDEAERVIGLLDRVDPRSYTVSTLRVRLAAAQQQQQREDRQAAASAQALQRASQEAAAATAQRPAAAAAPAQTSANAEPAAAQAAPAPSTPAPVAQSPVPAPPAPAAARGETREARPLRQAPPAFPVDAARRRQEGWVELEFTIGSDGAVRDVVVMRAQPPRVFDREAIRAMQRWTFEPALRDGQAVETRARRRIEFRL
jgi:protein TonB